MEVLECILLAIVLFSAYMQERVVRRIINVVTCDYGKAIARNRSSCSGLGAGARACRVGGPGRLLGWRCILGRQQSVLRF